MGRIKSNRKAAEALRKTLRQLESDPDVDSHSPAFVNIKCALLQRLLDLEVDTAETEASIHLLESPESEPAATATEDDKRTA